LPAPDLSNPKSAVLSVYAALRAGDLENAKRCFQFADAQQLETFELTATPLWGPLRLMHALRARFGDGAGKLFAAASLEKTVDKAVEDLKRAEVSIHGDKAVIAEKKAAIDPAAETEVTGITLKRQGEQWLIVPATFPDASAEIPPAQLPVMRSMRDAVKTACQGTLDRLAKGEFKTAEEAYAAYQSQLQQAVRPNASTKAR
jgi:ribosomal protein S20